MGKTNFPWRGISAATHQGNGTSIRLCGGMELLLFVVIQLFNSFFCFVKFDFLAKNLTSVK